MVTKDKRYIYEYDLGGKGEVLGRFNDRVDTESEELEERITKRINNEFYPTIGNESKEDFVIVAITYFLAHVLTTVPMMLGIMLILLFKGNESQYLADLGELSLITGVSITAALSFCIFVTVDSLKGMAESIYIMVLYPIALLTVYKKYKNYKQKVILEEDRKYWLNEWETVLNSGDVATNNLTVYEVLNTVIELENGYITRLYKVLKGDKEGVKFTTKLRVLSILDKQDKKLMSLNTTKELLTEHDLEYVYKVLKSTHDLEKEESQVLTAYNKLKQDEEERVLALKYIQDNRGMNDKKGREVSNLLLEGYNKTRLEEVRENISQNLEETKGILERLKD